MTADLGAPRVTAVRLVAVPTIPGQLAAADLRAVLQRNDPITAGTHVRLVVSRARYVDDTQVPLLAEWLRPAASVVVEGQSTLASQIRRDLERHWSRSSPTDGGESDR